MDCLITAGGTSYNKSDQALSSAVHSALSRWLCCDKVDVSQGSLVMVRSTTGACQLFGWSLALFLLPAVAQSQSVESFYCGKYVNVIIGYPPAGANDFSARRVARH